MRRIGVFRLPLDAVQERFALHQLSEETQERETIKAMTCDCANDFLRIYHAYSRGWFKEAQEMARREGGDGFKLAPAWDPPATFATECQSWCESGAALLEPHFHQGIPRLVRPSDLGCSTHQDTPKGGYLNKFIVGKHKSMKVRG